MPGPMGNTRSDPEELQKALDNAEAAPEPGPATPHESDPHAFVRSLYDRIRGRSEGPLAEDAQLELATLLKIAMSMSPQTLENNRVHFEAAFDLLTAQHLNLVIVRSLRFDLEAASEKSGGAVTRLLSRLSGCTPLNAVVSGILTVMFLVFLMFTPIALLGSAGINPVTYLSRYLPIFSDLKGMQVTQIFLILHASFLGSIVSILIRIREFLSLSASNALLIYVTVVTKPFLAACLALFVYTLLRTGFVSFGGVNLDGPNPMFLVWSIGFVAGFSERLVKDLIANVTTKFDTSQVPVGPNQK